MSDAKVMERLLIVEHKLDALIGAARVGVPPMASGLMCPACEKEISFSADFMSKMILRTCGCGHGQRAPMIGFGDLNSGARNDGRTAQDVRLGPERSDLEEG